MTLNLRVQLGRDPFATPKVNFTGQGNSSCDIQVPATIEYSTPLSTGNCDVPLASVAQELRFTALPQTAHDCNKAKLKFQKTKSDEDVPDRSTKLNVCVVLVDGPTKKLKKQRHNEAHTQSLWLRFRRLNESLAVTR